MMKHAQPLTIAALLLGLVACGMGGASEPPQVQVDPGGRGSKLQFAVGVATISYNAGKNSALGLNTVVTLRQSNGLSAVLYSQPIVIGPSNFNVLLSTVTGNQVQAAGGDLGSNHITWGTLNQSLWTGPPRGPKAASTGVFGYGFCPCNSDAGPVNGSSSLFQAFNLPIYGPNVYGPNAELFYGGPPAFPQEDPSVVALGFQGYSLGFADFAVKPVPGAYHLYAAVPPAYITPANPTPSPDPNGTPTPQPGVLAASAQLGSVKALPVFKNPTFKANGKGGGTVTIDVPAGASEAMVIVRSIHGSGDSTCAATRPTADVFYTLVAKGHGRKNLTLPDGLGPVTQSGATTPTICPQGSYTIYAVGTDYPAYEASYPNNLSMAPNIFGRGGQADVTTSDLASGQYP